MFDWMKKTKLVDITGLNANEADEKIHADIQATHMRNGDFIFPINREPLGDGKAEFLGEGSHEDFGEQEKKDKGIGGIFGL